MEYKYLVLGLFIFLSLCYAAMWSSISIPALGFFAGNCFALSIVRTSSPATAQSGSGDPVVTVKNGSYYGIHIPTYNQDAFLGIPYAQV